MDIAAIDYWANCRTSPIHRASTLGKGIAALAFVAAAVVASSPYLLLSIYLLLLAGVFASRLPARRLVMLAAYPVLFALLFAASRWNGELSGTVVIMLKTLTAAQAMVLLISTTPYPEIFAAAGKVMPGLLADGTFITYRSFFLLLREMQRMTMALSLRGGLRKGRWFSNLRNLSRALGMLVIRAIELSERLYAVLRIRGYRGRLQAGRRWRAVRRDDAIPLAAGGAAVALSLLAFFLPALWNAGNGLVLIASSVVALGSFLLNRGEAEVTVGAEREENLEVNLVLQQLRAEGAHRQVVEHDAHGHPHPPLPEVARVSCVRHVYPDGTEVSLCGLDFVAHVGERIVILGPNGAGKSTLLNHLLGLLTPADGEVRVLGHDPAREFDAIQPRLGVLLQNVDEQILGPTVAEDVAFGARNAGNDETRSAAMAKRAMERLGVLPLADKVPQYLSGGQKRKVALAGALVTDPELLVLDEPFEGLDPRSRNELVALLAELHRERGLAMILTTHDVDLVPLLADTVYVLADGGQIVAKGSPDEVFEQVDLLRKSAIEPPALTALFRKLRDAGVDLDNPSDLDEAARLLLTMMKPSR